MDDKPRTIGDRAIDLMTTTQKDPDPHQPFDLLGINRARRRNRAMRIVMRKLNGYFFGKE